MRPAIAGLEADITESSTATRRSRSSPSCPSSETGRAGVIKAGERAAGCRMGGMVAILLFSLALSKAQLSGSELRGRVIDENGSPIDRGRQGHGATKRIDSGVSSWAVA